MLDYNYYDIKEIEYSSLIRCCYDLVWRNEALEVLYIKDKNNVPKNPHYIILDLATDRYFSFKNHSIDGFCHGDMEATIRAYKGICKEKINFLQPRTPSISYEKANEILENIKIEMDEIISGAPVGFDAVLESLSQAKTWVMESIKESKNIKNDVQE